ncbi:cytochrome P450 [Aspergillus cavernicola]|uniref:Cytochrome P450 n=1 Tax=Aspergillus cavernicola TaxID=176166 RepID=A0ABR4IH56_9EURO
MAPHLVQGINSGVGLSVALGLTWAVFAILSPKQGVKGKVNRTESEWLYTSAKKRFIDQGRYLCKTAFEETAELRPQMSPNAFYIMTARGVEMILSHKYADEIRNGDRFNASKWAEKFLLPIWEKINHFLQAHWTRSPSKDRWAEWHAISLHTNMEDLMAEVLSRLFLGPELCRNLDWLRVTVSYNTDLFVGVVQLNLWPPLFAASYSQARRVLGPIVAESRSQRARGDRQEDLLQWFEDGPKGSRYDTTLLLLKASMAAAHKSSELLTQTTSNLCTRPDLVKDLREEVVRVFRRHGLPKSAVYEVRLVDSVLKETQGLKPISLNATNDPISTATFTRLTLDNIKLSDGLELAKGTMIQLSNCNMWDPQVSEYSDGDRFDGYWFYKRRQLPGYENSGQLVTTHTNRLGFGHGKYACPGRFFAASAAKLILPVPVHHAEGQDADPFCKIAVRRRQEEFDLSSLAEAAN